MTNRTTNKTATKKFNEYLTIRIEQIKGYSISYSMLYSPTYKTRPYIVPTAARGHENAVQPSDLEEGLCYKIRQMKVGHKIIWIGYKLLD